MSTVITRQGSQYTDEQRREAVIQYAILGNKVEVEKATGIPDSTLEGWIKQPWFETILGEIRDEANALIHARAIKTLHKAFDEIEDRLDSGDEVVTKFGDKVRVKVKARDAAVIAAIMFDKRQILLRQPTSITARSQGEDIAETLTAWMRAQKARTIEGSATGTTESAEAKPNGG